MVETVSLDGFILGCIIMESDFAAVAFADFRLSVPFLDLSGKNSLLNTSSQAILKGKKGVSQAKRVHSFRFMRHCH